MTVIDYRSFHPHGDFNVHVVNEIYLKDNDHFVFDHSSKVDVDAPVCAARMKTLYEAAVVAVNEESAKIKVYRWMPGSGTGMSTDRDKHDRIREFEVQPAPAHSNSALSPPQPLQKRRSGGKKSGSHTPNVPSQVSPVRASKRKAINANNSTSESGGKSGERANDRRRRPTMTSLRGAEHFLSRSLRRCALARCARVR